MPESIHNTVADEMANGSLSQSRAQHYVPKFYLKGFTDPKGVLWVLERFKAPRASRPKDEAHHPDYYCHTEKGEADDGAEDALQVIESRSAPIIPKLANPQYVLTPENLEALLVFVASMFVRVPSWREFLDKKVADIIQTRYQRYASDKDKFYALCADYEKAMGKLMEVSHEELRQYVLAGNYEMVQKSVSYNLGAMFRTASIVLNGLMTFGHQILYAPEGMTFLTSDSPVFTLLPDGQGEATIGVGFGWRGVEVFFPLNKRACLRLKERLKPGARKIEPDYTNKINRLVMATATRYVYSSEGHRRIGRLFDQHGCRIRPGKESCF